MSDNDDVVAELELIQNIIDRQADNSFKIKGWTISLIVVALIFRSNDYALFIAFIPLLAFWGLDAYYLRNERRCRKMYEYVRSNADDPDRERFKMDPSDFDDEVDPIRKLMLSNSVFWFYGAISLGLVGYMIFTIFIGFE